ncbi:MULTISPECIES: N-6 DNA methylase [unclassified Microcoleus]|uniref:N-6 DNA methylase n=1 Tax=unclassified Microcoleus TaxID=2642155 RepID=UPI002FCFC3AF
MIANSAYELLESAYTGLNFDEGDLLSSEVSFAEITSEQWIEKGDWLNLAKQVRIEKVFFVKNNPVIVFAKCDDQEDEKVRQMFNKIWCMARPNYLFLAKEGELAIYDLTKPPARNVEEWKKNKPLEVAKNTTEVVSKLYHYRREQIESGKLFEDERFGSSNQRADQSLIQDLKTVRSALMSQGLSGSKIKYAHALIGRSIFIRYLEDRAILTKEYFQEIAQNDPIWQALLNAPDDELNIEKEAKQYYIKVLSNKGFTYALFHKLSQHFNGDMFPSDRQEEESIEQEHLSLLQNFLKGDVDEQKKLFFWAYKFDIIPISLISSIYEEFYHESNTEKSDHGTHYTPSSLVEFLLSKVLTSDCLTTNPRILDPCCGSGIFLVEAFRRIVRYRVYQNHKQRLNWQELRDILKSQIAGIEINSEAIRVAAFSLYLALLNYQEPPDILSQIKQGQILPSLIYKSNSAIDNDNFNNLVCANAFTDFSRSEYPILSNNFSSQCADVIVGNPPWGSPKTTDRQGTQELNIALKWCQEYDYPVGDKERSQAFIWRVLDFLKDNGWSALLVSTSIFFKIQDNNNAFRQQWLSSVLLKEVVNFAHVRDVFFQSSNSNKSSSAISPFASIIFQKVNQTELNLKDQVVSYWSAKKKAIIKNIKAVILSIVDRRGIRQSDLLRNDSFWKIYYWGNHQDAGLIQSIKLAPTLKELHDPSNSGQGFSEGKTDKKDSPLLPTLFPTDKFERYGLISSSWFEKPPKQVTRPRKATLYRGERLLIKRGISQRVKKQGEIVARFESETFSVRNSINSIKLLNPETWKYQVILGIIWSSLPRYYFFLTSSNWGIWHDEIYTTQYLSLPIIFPTAILRTVLDIVESPKPLLAICWTIFSRFK